METVKSVHKGDRTQTDYKVGNTTDEGHEVVCCWYQEVANYTVVYSVTNN